MSLVCSIWVKWTANLVAMFTGFPPIYGSSLMEGITVGEFENQRFYSYVLLLSQYHNGFEHLKKCYNKSFWKTKLKLDFLFHEVYIYISCYSEIKRICPVIAEYKKVNNTYKTIYNLNKNTPSHKRATWSITKLNNNNITHLKVHNK
jgi:hypothetical protein